VTISRQANDAWKVSLQTTLGSLSDIIIITLLLIKMTILFGFSVSQEMSINVEILNHEISDPHPSCLGG
jgi:hypothetical protein